MRLDGQTAVITGGGSGIGYGIARALAGEGCRVAIGGRRESKLREAAEAFAGSPPLLFHTVDVADRASVTELFRWAAEQLGPIDILVNSAGLNIARRAVAELDPNDWDRMISINATGAYNCIHAVLPQMRQRQSGLIVNISSIAGKRAMRVAGVGYCASKFAITALGSAVALEEGRNGIRVTNIYPGEVDTPILDMRPTPVTAEQRARILQPEDVAAAVRMVACLPPRAHVSELVIKPTTHDYA